MSLGSNSADAELMLARAREEIGRLGGVTIARVSRIYYTEPQQYSDQPWFHNQVLALDCAAAWDPGGLMEALLDMETRLGRKRDGIRFGPRCIDADILLFGSRASADAHCTVPHPRLFCRAFVLVPLMEIAPAVQVGGKTPAELLQGLMWHEEQGKIYQSG